MGQVLARAQTPLGTLLCRRNSTVDRALFNTLLVIEDYTDIAHENAVFKVMQHTISETTHYPLACFIKQSSTLVFLYDPQFIASSELETLAARYCYLMQQLPLVDTFNDFHFLLPAERQALAAANSTTASAVHAVLFLEQYASVAQRHPTHVALMDDTCTVIYRDLQQASDAIAYHLVHHGVRKGDIVPLCCVRSVQRVIAQLGILKAGGAYLPMDTAWPVHFTKTVLWQSRATVLLLDSMDNAARYATATLSVYALDEWVATCAAPVHLPDILPTDLAYVIYTSGSTGVPKGVMINHHALADRLSWIQSQYGMALGEVILHKTPYSFDVSVWEIFWPLSCGGTLRIAPPGKHTDPYYLLDIIEHAAIHYLHFVPSTLSVLLSACTQKMTTTLKTIFCIGEALTQEVIQPFFHYFSCQLDNLYGPTEATIIATRWSCDPTSTSACVPIGHVIDRVCAHVMSQHGYEYPFGLAGELYLSGTGLAEGYLHQREATNRAFVMQRIGASVTRRYRTGDRGYRTSDGLLMYLGRQDTQIKRSGHRLECQAIEHALMQDDAIALAVVIFHQASQHLVAFLQSSQYPMGDLQPTLAAALRERLLECLPMAAIPSQFVVLAHWPQLANGKLDRGALVKQAAQRAQLKRPFINAGDDRISALNTLVQAVTPIPALMPSDSLLHVGLSSFQLVNVLVRINQQFGCRLTLDTLYHHASLEARALLTKTVPELPPSTPRCLVPIQPDGHKTPLVLIHPIGGTIFCFYALGHQGDPERPLYAIQDIGLTDPHAEFDTMAAMAAYYVAQLTTYFKEAPFILGGLSFGANLAVEMAHQLGAAYTEPILLLDGWAHYPDVVFRENHLKPYLNQYFKEAYALASTDAEPVVPSGFLSIHEQRASLLAHHTMHPIKHDLILFKAQTTASVLVPIEAPDNHWRAYATKGLKVVLTPGDHETLLLGSHEKILSNHQTYQFSTLNTQGTLCTL